MNGFLPLDDLEPTLTDVLAFIDTFGSDATTSSSSDDGQSSPLPAPQVSSAVERRKSRKAAASRRCQQKKRAELLALRAQVTALESRLQELKSIGQKFTVGHRLDKSQKLKITQLWRDKARLEHQLRLQSEERNRQLMTVLARQSTVAQAVRDVLSNVTAVVNIEEALRTPPPSMPSGLEGFSPNLNDAVYGELSIRLGRLYVDVKTKFTELGQIQIQDLSTGVQVKRDAVTGMPFVELKTAMTVDLDLKQTEMIVMSKKACRYNKMRKYVTDLGVKKEMEYELHDEEMEVALSTLLLSRRYEDENRMILTFSSLLCDQPTDTGLRFREEGFIMMAKSPTNQQVGTVVQSYYRLTPEVSSESFTPTSSGRSTEDANVKMLFVLQNLGGVMWSNFQKTQASCNEAQLNPALISAAS